MNYHDLIKKHDCPICGLSTVESINNDEVISIWCSSASNKFEAHYARHVTPEKNHLEYKMIDDIMIVNQRINNSWYSFILVDRVMYNFGVQIPLLNKTSVYEFIKSNQIITLYNQYIFCNFCSYPRIPIQSYNDRLFSKCINDNHGLSQIGYNDISYREIFNIDKYCISNSNVKYSMHHTNTCYIDKIEPCDYDSNIDFYISIFKSNFRINVKTLEDIQNLLIIS